MFSNKLKIFYLFKFVFLGLFIFPTILFASTSDGTILNPNQYAWGENVGWINFGTTGGNVHITASRVTGYAWDSRYGWVNLSPTNGGVLNDGQGNLSGYAWSAGAGYINFSGVVINSSGRFTGQAGTASTTYGRINFDCTNCAVVTDWRPASRRSGGSYTTFSDSILVSTTTATTTATISTTTTTTSTSTAPISTTTKSSITDVSKGKVTTPTFPTILIPKPSITDQKISTTTASTTKTDSKSQVKIVPRPAAKVSVVNQLLNSNPIQSILDAIINIYRRIILLLTSILGN